MAYEKQVDKKHYSFERYVDRARWMSYWHQVNEIVSREDIKSILEIGPGTDFLRQVVKLYRPDITHHTIDIATDLSPDIVGGVTSMPVDDNSYDLVCAFQVLEHIEFTDFETAVKEMKRVSNKYVFISLPHFGPSIEFQFKIPLIPRIQWSCKVPFPKIHVFGGQHYWEVGKKGYSPKKINNVLKTHLELEKEFVPFENQYHRFYIANYE